MNIISNRMFSIKTLYFIAIIGFILSHVPFLSSDSDSSIATGSRGAWTDEGLNTCQIRNFVTHNHFDLLDCDNFLKTPLFSVTLYPFFKIFGISMVGARLITVFFISVLLLLFIQRLSTIWIGLFLIFTTLMFFPIHQYSHLCLAEIYSSMIIAVSLLYYSYSRITNKWLNLLILYTLLFIAVLFKIQFAYILAIPIMLKSLEYLIDKSVHNKNQLLISGGFLIVIILGMIGIWYLQFEKEWEKIIAIHSTHFSIHNISIESIWSKVKDNFLSPKFVLFTSFFFVALILSIRQLYENKLTKECRTLLVLSLIWVLIEFHKLSFSYLPIRYLISFYLSMGFLISIVFGNYMTHRIKSYKYIARFSLIILLTFNCYSNIHAFYNRTFVMHELNNYFQNITKEDDVIIGTWASAFTWNTRCLSFPIWTDFLHGRNILHYYQPNFIVYEDEEKDSGYAYKNNNISLDSISIPLKKTRVAFWNINVIQVKK
jgi:hypothetical protein